MKKTMKSFAGQLMLIFLAAQSFIAVNAQNISAVKDAEKICWRGVDLTKARLVGTEIDFANPDNIVSNYYAAWNNLFVSEPAKYDLQGALKKKIDNKIDKALESNAAVEKTNLVVSSRNELTEADLKEAVKKYITSDGGVGMTMVVENLDKPMQSVRLYVVFFDQANGEILYSQKYEKKVAGGMGFRNYWASGYYVVIKQLKEDFPGWKANKK
jgi:hypothetical protein